MSGHDEHGQEAPAQGGAPVASHDNGPLIEATARRELLEASNTAAGIGTFDWDLTTGLLLWDDRLVELFGFAQGAFGSSIEAFNAAVHPEDLPEVTQRVQEAIDSCGEFSAEYRIVRPDGEGRWIGARGRVLSDERRTPVRMLGAAWDVTAHREGEVRIQRVLESMSTAFFSIDTTWRFTYVNARAEALLGLTREQMLGAVIWELFPAAVGSDIETHYRHSMATGETATFDAYYPPPLDAWYEVRAWRNPEGLAVYFLDITARHTAQVSAERAAERSTLLARVATELAETLDAEAALAALPRLLVPILGDWCISTLADQDAQDWRERVRDVGSWHADPALRTLTEDYRRHRIDSLASRSAVTGALELTGPVAIQHDAAAHSSASLAGKGEALLARLAPGSTVALPLRGRGHVLGLLTVSNSLARGPFTETDLATLGEVAAQVGLALDNARLHAAQRDLATELQASLLTALPQPDHLQLSARYLPAARGVAIGGDWYDAFMVKDGSTSLVIGDVAGHDRGAAVAMAQVRNILRGVAHALVEPPATVLSALDLAMRDLAVGTLTTVVLARVEQSPDDASRGLRTLRWSNAGHPPPLLIGPDGRAQLLAPTPDLLLGVAADSPRHDHTHSLEPGATILLYTDGLVERRGEDLDVGLERLRRTASELANLDLESLCDAVLAALAGDAEDDVALLALRTHPQDAPRPPEAGPSLLPVDLQAAALRT